MVHLDMVCPNIFCRNPWELSLIFFFLLEGVEFNIQPLFEQPLNNFQDLLLIVCT